MQYIPDKWVILEIEPGEVYKVLGGWKGGYLGADEWRLNSGIKELKEEEDCYVAVGHSGSEYYMNKQSEGLTMFSAGVLKSMQDRYPQITTVTVEEYRAKMRA